MQNRNKDGAADGSYSALLFSVRTVFVCFSKTISFTRDELLNIRQNTPQNLLLDFDYSDVLLYPDFDYSDVLIIRTYSEP